MSTVDQQVVELTDKFVESASTYNGLYKLQCLMAFTREFIDVEAVHITHIAAVAALDIFTRRMVA